MVGGTGVATATFGGFDIVETFTGRNKLKEKVFKGNENAYYEFETNLADACILGSAALLPLVVDGIKVKQSSTITSSTASTTKTTTSTTTTEDVPDENTNKIEFSDINDGSSASVDDALTMADDYLGPGYKDMGNGRFVSSDSARQVRMSASELAGHGGMPPHFNFDRLLPSYSTNIYLYYQSKDGLYERNSRIY